jgi:hypothetical protein
VIRPARGRSRRREHAYLDRDGPTPTNRGPDPAGAGTTDLLGHTVVIIGGGTGVGAATARRAKTAGARLIVTDRHRSPLEDLAEEIGVEAIFVVDETDAGGLAAFLDGLPEFVDHLMLSLAGVATGPAGAGPLTCVARYAQREMRPGGSLVLIATVPAGPVPPGPAPPAQVPPGSVPPGAAPPGLVPPGPVPVGAVPIPVARLAVELAPVRVNLIAVTPDQARMSPDDIARRAVHLMTDPAVTGTATTISGGGVGSSGQSGNADGR